jgi:hypothetical protein
VSSEKDDDDGSLSFKSDAVNFCGGGQSGDLVDVISIGSRKDAVVDFCFDSPLQLSSSLLRFWYRRNSFFVSFLLYFIIDPLAIP